jgi:hypothetical protein
LSVAISIPLTSCRKSTEQEHFSKTEALICRQGYLDRNRFWRKTPKSPRVLGTDTRISTRPADSKRVKVRRSTSRSIINKVTERICQLLQDQPADLSLSISLPSIPNF